MKHLSKLLFIFLLSSFFSITACSDSGKVSGEEARAQAKAAGIHSINVTDAEKKYTAKEAIIIDVREKNEWDEGHIAGAIHIPVAQLHSHLTELEQYKDQPIIMQCRSGRRSALAAVTLNSAGFKELYNLEGGILAWEKAGLAVEK